MAKASIMAAAVAAAAIAGLIGANADPVEQDLVIDGQKMTNKKKAPEGHPFDTVLSGWLFRTDETRALEADSFANPAMVYVGKGEEIWNKVDGTAGKSCASCHQEAAKTMKDVGAHYPKWDPETKRPINVELQIDKCRVKNMGAEPYKFDSGEQKALTTYIKHQALGEQVKIDLGQGEMKKWWEQGKDIYYTRYGQLNMSCATCHEVNAGRYIRADHLSQGQVNGFPTYRLKNANIVSLHNRFRGCIRDTRAEFPKAFSDELMALEVYVTWRGTGLSVETPAVRH